MEHNTYFPISAETEGFEEKEANPQVRIEGEGS